jgi:hypothetical protein
MNHKHVNACVSAYLQWFSPCSALLASMCVVLCPAPFLGLYSTHFKCYCWEHLKQKQVANGYLLNSRTVKQSGGQDVKFSHMKPRIQITRQESRSRIRTQLLRWMTREVGTAKLLTFCKKCGASQSLFLILANILVHCGRKCGYYVLESMWHMYVFYICWTQCSLVSGAWFSG